LRALIGHSVLLFEYAGREGFGRDATCERRVVVDVEFEEVEELVRDKVNRTINFLLNAEEELEGAVGFVAGRERNVLQLAAGVGYVFACFTGGRLRLPLRGERGKMLHCTVQTADGNWLARVVATCFLEGLQGLLTAHRAGE
jgi:hypothetical protein